MSTNPNSKPRGSLRVRASKALSETVRKARQKFRENAQKITSKMPEVRTYKLMSSCNPTIAFILINIIRLIIMYNFYILLGINVMPLINLMKEGIVYLLDYISRENLLLILMTLWNWCSWFVEHIFNIIITSYEVLNTTVTTWITLVAGIFWGMYQQDKGSKAAFKVAATNIADQAKMNKGFIDVIKFAASAEVVAEKAVNLQTRATAYQTKVTNAINAVSTNIVMKGAPETWSEWSTKPLNFIYKYGIIFLLNSVKTIIVKGDDFFQILINKLCDIFNLGQDKIFSMTEINNSIKIDDENINILLGNKVGIVNIQKIIDGFDEVDVNEIAVNLVAGAISDQSGVNEITCPSPENIQEITQLDMDDAIKVLSTTNSTTNTEALQVATMGLVDDINTNLGDNVDVNGMPDATITEERDNTLKSDPPKNSPELENSILRATSIVRISSIPVIDPNTDQPIIDPNTGQPVVTPVSWFQWFLQKCHLAGGRRRRGGRATRRKPKKLSGRKRRQVGRGRRTKHKNRRTRRM